MVSTKKAKLLTCFKPEAADHISGEECGGKRKKRAGRSFSGALKAIFFKTRLLRKPRSENSKLSPQKEKLFEPIKRSLSCNAGEIIRFNSGRSSSTSSGGHTASPLGIQRSDSADRMKQKSKGRSCFRRSHEMVMFMVCLVALVFWGKAFAILTCTSTWFFLASGGRSRRFRRADIDVDTAEYKKMVIMKGLLERNPSSLLSLRKKL